MFELQWGHGFSAVDNPVYESCRDERDTLQWGHGFSAVDNRSRRKLLQIRGFRGALRAGAGLACRSAGSCRVLAMQLGTGLGVPVRERGSAFSMFFLFMLSKNLRPIRVGSRSLPYRRSRRRRGRIFLPSPIPASPFPATGGLPAPVPDPAAVLKPQGYCVGFTFASWRLCARSINQAVPKKSE